MLITSLTETEGSDSSSRTRPSVTEESSKSSRTLKLSSISSGSSSVCLIYGPQLKLSSFERPLIFFSTTCSHQEETYLMCPDGCGS